LFAQQAFASRATHEITFIEGDKTPKVISHQIEGVAARVPAMLMNTDSAREIVLLLNRLGMSPEERDQRIRYIARFKGPRDDEKILKHAERIFKDLLLLVHQADLFTVKGRRQSLTSHLTSNLDRVDQIISRHAVHFAMAHELVLDQGEIRTASEADHAGLRRIFTEAAWTALLDLDSAYHDYFSLDWLEDEDTRPDLETYLEGRFALKFHAVQGSYDARMAPLGLVPAPLPPQLVRDAGVAAGGLAATWADSRWMAQGGGDTKIVGDGSALKSAWRDLVDPNNQKPSTFHSAAATALFGLYLWTGLHVFVSAAALGMIFYGLKAIGEKLNQIRPKTPRAAPYALKRVLSSV